MPNLHYTLRELPGLDEPKRKCPSGFSVDEISSLLDDLSHNVGMLDGWEVGFVDAMVALLDKGSFLSEGRCNKIIELRDRLNSSYATGDIVVF